jgi:hypothetical protein
MGLILVLEPRVMNQARRARSSVVRLATVDIHSKAAFEPLRKGRGVGIGTCQHRHTDTRAFPAWNPPVDGSDRPYSQASFRPEQHLVADQELRLESNALRSC